MPPLMAEVPGVAGQVSVTLRGPPYLVAVLDGKPMVITLREPSSPSTLARRAKWKRWQESSRAARRATPQTADAEAAKATVAASPSRPWRAKAPKDPAHAAQRATKSIVDGFKDYDLAQQASILQRLLNHEKLRDAVAASGVANKGDAAEQAVSAIKAFIEDIHASEQGGRGKRRRSLDGGVRNAMYVISAAVAGPDMSEQNFNEVMGLKPRTGGRWYRIGRRKREELVGQDRSQIVVTAPKHQGGVRVTDEQKKEAAAFIENHGSVRCSPLTSHQVLVRDPDTGERERKRIKHTERGLTPIYADYVKHHNGAPPLRERTFRSCCPANVKSMALRHRMFCGCIQCVEMRLLHTRLKVHRTTLRTQMKVAPADLLDHGDIDGALKSITCPCVDGGEFPSLFCAEGSCPKCPEYEEKAAEWADDKQMTYQWYGQVDYTTATGVQKKKVGQIKSTGSYKEFMTYYLKKLKQHKLHRWTKRFIHDAGRMRKEAVQGGTKTYNNVTRGMGIHVSRDFNEKYSDSPFQEVQSEHWHSRGLTMEVARIDATRRQGEWIKMPKYDAD